MRLSRLCASNQQALIDSVRQLLTVLAHTGGVPRQYSGECQVLFQKLLKENPMFSSVGALDMQGKVICSAPAVSAPTNLADRAFFQRAVASHAFAIGDFAVGRISGKPTLHMALPVWNEAGVMTAVVYVGLDLRAMSEFGTRVTLPGVMISWMRSMRNRYFWPSISKPTNCAEAACFASGARADSIRMYLCEGGLRAARRCLRLCKGAHRDIAWEIGQFKFLPATACGDDAVGRHDRYDVEDPIGPQPHSPPSKPTLERPPESSLAPCLQAFSR